MSKFNWPFEISGFGGGYEQACRDMAEAGAEWLGKHPGIVKEWMDAQDEYMKRTGESYYPLHERPESYKEFEKALLAVCDDCTGAMFGAAKSHAISIAERGFEGHCKFVLDARKDEVK